MEKQAILPPAARIDAPVPSARHPRRTPWIAAGAFAAAFGLPLFELLRFAAGSDLYSHVLLIPLVSLYVAIVAQKRPSSSGRPNRTLAVALLFTGTAVLLGTMAAVLSGVRFALEDRLALTTAAFVIALAGACAWFMAPAAFRARWFPLGFLLFMIPIPTAVLPHVEIVMQHGSAAVARVLYSLSGMPVFYDDLTFQLPGIALRVAPECSGIRSTLVLLIVSVLTGYLFLRSPRRRAWLALAVIPLALARNGFRIFVIGELCVRIGPEMIDSYLHRKGGPIFFALSLVPLFLLLIGLQRGERRLVRNRADPLPSATH